jgi:ankyrin repeat protein
MDDVEKAKLLVDRGAHVNVRTADGRTPLLMAAGSAGGGAVTRLLLDRGADPMLKGTARGGEITPLLQSFRSGDHARVRLFLDRGSEERTADIGALLASLATGCDDCAVLALKQLDQDAITRAMTNLPPPGTLVQWIPRLLQAGGNPNARDRDGRTVLMRAAASDVLPEEAIRALIERGADVNATSPSGETALSMARLRGDTPIVKLLLQAGAKDDRLPPASPSNFAPAPSARAAVERSLPLLQRTDVTFLKKSGCVSCHHNSLTAMTVAASRAAGIAVDDAIARQQVNDTAAYLDRWRDRALQGLAIAGSSDTISYILAGLAAERHPPDEATDAMARYIRSQQLANGAWRIVAHRPPIESSEIELAALCLRALQVYAPAAKRADYQTAIDRAASWIAQATPRVTEDRAFQLLGLHWSGAPAAAIRASARDLIAEQRSDGGWAQLPTLESDAYATGQALVSLVQSGAVASTDPVYARGVQFLLRTQFADGSWFVRSRSLPIQPHFDTGFPFGRDQFISAAATNWAAMALALAAPRSESAAAALR